MSIPTWKAIALAVFIVFFEGQTTCSGLAPALTPREQAALLAGREALFDGAYAKRAALGHLRQAGELLHQIDGLPGSFGHARRNDFVSVGDGTRKANPLYRRALGEILKAAQLGVPPGQAVSTVLDDSSSRIPRTLRTLRSQSLLNDLKASRELGLDTPENIVRLRKGSAPIVTKGNPKYVGTLAEVDHRDPSSKAPRFENEIANLRMLPQRLNRDKSDSLSPLEAGNRSRLQHAYWTGGGLGAAAQFGFGAVLFVREGPAAVRSFREAWNTGQPVLHDVLRGSRHSAFALAGTGGMLSGGARMGAALTTGTKHFSNFRQINRLGRNLGIIGVGVGEALLVVEWEAGRLNNREFWTMQSSMGGGLAGAWIGTKAGAATGAAIGVWFEGVGAVPGAFFGGIAGGISGAWGGSELGQFLAVTAYARLDDEQKRELEAFIVQRYAR